MGWFDAEQTGELDLRQVPFGAVHAHIESQIPFCCRHESFRHAVNIGIR